MAEGARMAEELGADIIDINMGCPAREVTGKQAGSALMRDLDHATRLVEAVVGAVGVPVTLEDAHRLGRGQPQRAGLGAARRGRRRRRSSPCMRARAASSSRARPTGPSCAASRRPCACPSSSTATSSIPRRAQAALDASGADAVMVGRGAYGAPWMPARIDATLTSGRDPGPPPLARQGAIARRHVEAMLTEHGARHGLRIARKHVGWYLASSGRPARRRARPGAGGCAPSEDAGEVLGGLAVVLRRSAPGDGRMNDAARDPGRASSQRRHIEHDLLLAALPHPVLVLGDDDRVLYANLAAETFFSLSHGMLKRQTLPDIIAFSSPLGALVGQVRKSGATVNEYGVEVDLPRSGVHRLVDVFAGGIPEQPGLIVLMLQQRSMAQMIERQLTHRAAARSVSGMAAVLAHEIKNPLSGIRGAAQLLEPGLEDEDRALTQLICTETDRIRDLVDRMEVFGDERPLAAEPVNIHSVLDHVKRLAETGFADGIKINVDYDPSLPPLPGNRDKLDPGLPQPGEERGRGHRGRPRARPHRAAHGVPAGRAPRRCPAPARASACR